MNPHDAVSSSYWGTAVDNVVAATPALNSADPYVENCRGFLRGTNDPVVGDGRSRADVDKEHGALSAEERRKMSVGKGTGTNASKTYIFHLGQTVPLTRTDFRGKGTADMTSKRVAMLLRARVQLAIAALNKNPIRGRANQSSFFAGDQAKIDAFLEALRVEALRQAKINSRYI